MRILAALAPLPLLTGAASAGDSTEPWISLNADNTRSADVFAWISDGDQEIIDAAGDESPEFFDGYWGTQIEARCYAGPAAYATITAEQSSGVTNGLWLILFTHLSTITNAPWGLVVAASETRFEGSVRVHRPTRVRANAGTLVNAPHAPTAEIRLSTFQGSITLIESSGDAGASERFLTLPAGLYWLEGVASIEALDAVGAAGTEAIAGLALTPSVSCNAADVAEPHGALDALDVFAFLVAFAQGGTDADLAWPPLTLDLADVLVFLELFGAGCP